MQVANRVAGIALLIAVSALGGFAQTKSIYLKNGLSFSYLAGWDIKEKADKEADEIGLSNAETDAQVTVIVLRKELDSKDRAEARKRVIEPWLKELQRLYEQLAQVKMARVDTTTTVAGQTVEAVDFNFMLDEQQGKVQACWIMFDKQLVLLYMVRPQRTAEKAELGWAAVRDSLKVEKKK